MVDKFWYKNVKCLSCNKLKTKLQLLKNTTQNLIHITALFSSSIKCRSFCWSKFRL